MSKRSIALLLEDMIEAIEKIRRFTDGYDLPSFLQDDKTKDAVVRNLEVIGEAANRIPQPFRDLSPTIPWKRIIGLRNRIVHEYFGIDPLIIWQIVQTDLPNFHELLQNVYNNLKHEEL